MLSFLTILLMVALGYAFLVEGIFTACLMCCNVFFAGLIAFNFWEPIANQLDTLFARSFMEGYEDWLTLVLLFALSLALLRTITNTLDNTLIEFDEYMQRIGGAIFGVVTGYLVSGFLICVLQTLPWHENFMNFDPILNANEGPLARLFPPDRVWLALMHRAGEVPLSAGDDQTFDKFGTFELRYGRFRRFGESRPAYPYGGEFERELGRMP
jgi:hypothetical protein